MKCNNEDKFFCKECNEFLCDKCKLKHSHNTKHIIDIVFFDSYVKFEIEKNKEEINVNYSKFEKIENLNKKLGLKNIFNYFEEFNVQLKIIQENLKNTLWETKIIQLNSCSNMIKDTYTMSKNKTELLNFYLKLRETKGDLVELTKATDGIFKIFDDKEIFFADLKKFMFLQNNINNNNNLIDSTFNLSTFNINNFDDDKQFKSFNNDKIHNLIKSNEFEEKIKLLTNEDAKLLEINDKFSKEMRILTQFKSKLTESNENLIGELKRANTLDSNRQIINKEEFVKIEKNGTNSELLNLLLEIKDNIFEDILNDLTEKKFTQNYFDELDQISVQSYLKCNIKSIFEKLKLNELIFENYSEIKDIHNYFRTNFTNFTKTTFFNKINQKIYEKLSDYYFDLVYENKNALMVRLFDNFLLSYCSKSKKIKSQKNIDLKSCQLNDNDISKLIFILQNSVKLGDIFLQNNEITDKGFFLLFPIIFGSQSIKNVYLDNNKLTENSLKNINSYIKNIDTKQVKLKVLSMQGNNLSEKGKDILKSIKIVLKVLIYI